jgi:SAM-dependent methyltransferase
MDKNGKVFQKHYSKFRQINRYLEILDDVYEDIPKHPDRPLRIIDFGCGKAYLTFAVYYYLKVLHNRDVEIIGLDLKEDVIEFCNKVAQDLHYDELKFLMGDIADYTNDHADMVVTLHACDTATDYALINAVKWNTKVILSVPCCQHELFSQIDNDIHQPMYKHGILKDRFTELLTDGLRGLKLEARGYDVAMIEFTSLEHTSKNIMIKAVKNGKGSKKAEAEYQQLKEFYKVDPTIDVL